MTSAIATNANLRLNFNDRDYEFEELPEKAQYLLKDMVRLEQQIGELGYELRHLHAAKELYGKNLRTTMLNEEHEQENSHHDGNGQGHESG